MFLSFHGGDDSVSVTGSSEASSTEPHSIRSSHELARLRRLAERRRQAEQSHHQPPSEGLAPIPELPRTVTGKRRMVEETLRRHGSHEAMLREFRRLVLETGTSLGETEVRFENLSIEVAAVSGRASIPTVSGAFVSTLKSLTFQHPKPQNMKVLDGVSGVIRPGELTLLVGPPSSGKSLFLQALSGKLIGKGDVTVTGSVTFNGHTMAEIVPERSIGYVEQYDNHIPLLTVRETLDFAQRCQGPGWRASVLECLREKLDDPTTDPSLVAFIKGIGEPLGGKLRAGKSSVFTELILDVLSLKHCADTIVGNPMIRGVSGGEKKRVTLGEQMVSGRKLLMLDEISTGLDSRSTYNIVAALQRGCRYVRNTTLVSLLQPAPEVVALFDKIIVLSDKKIVYHGPPGGIGPFFDRLGLFRPEGMDPMEHVLMACDPRDQALFRKDLDGDGAGYLSDGDGKPGQPGQAPPFISGQEMAEVFYSETVEGQEALEALRSPLACEPLPAVKGPRKGFGGFLSRITGGKPRNLADDPPTGEVCAPGSARAVSGLVTTTYALTPMEQMIEIFKREMILYRRNIAQPLSRIFQVVLVALMTGFLFWKLQVRVQDGAVFIGFLFYTIVQFNFSGFTESGVFQIRRSVFIKQRDNRFYNPVSHTLVYFFGRLPFALIESTLWCCITYWMVGLTSSPGRFFIFWLLVFLTHYFSSALFRATGTWSPNATTAQGINSTISVIFVVLSGFTIAESYIPGWWIWVYWGINALSYGLRGMVVNEFSSERWQQPAPGDPQGRTMEQVVLENVGFRSAYYWRWLAPVVYAGFILVFALIVLAGEFMISRPERVALQPPGAKQMEEREAKARRRRAKKLVRLQQKSLAGLKRAFGDIVPSGRRPDLAPSGVSERVAGPGLPAPPPGSAAAATAIPEAVPPGAPVDLQPLHPVPASLLDAGSGPGPISAAPLPPSPPDWADPTVPLSREDTAGSPELSKRGDKSENDLPIIPVSLAFRNLRYFVPGGGGELELLRDLSGAFLPGTLSALMGPSGSGKTTLMDVLTRRKNTGRIEGTILMNGAEEKDVPRPVFSRLTGYVEQADFHTAALTVHESLLFSARLRLPRGMPRSRVAGFVDYAESTLELSPIKGALVGLPGISGLSLEQRKRLTVGVEWVGNPSILFLDEPTSGLDSRSARIVARAIRSVADTGRTVICTIHQPAKEVFALFTDLLLLRPGGEMVYGGPLGKDAEALLSYLESIPGVPRFEGGPTANVANYILDLTALSAQQLQGSGEDDEFQESEEGSGTAAERDDAGTGGGGAGGTSWVSRALRGLSGRTWGKSKASRGAVEPPSQEGGGASQPQGSSWMSRLRLLGPGHTDAGPKVDGSRGGSLRLASRLASREEQVQRVEPLSSYSTGTGPTTTTPAWSIATPSTPVVVPVPAVAVTTAGSLPRVEIAQDLADADTQESLHTPTTPTTEYSNGASQSQGPRPHGHGQGPDGLDNGKGGAGAAGAGLPGDAEAAAELMPDLVAAYEASDLRRKVEESINQVAEKQGPETEFEQLRAAALSGALPKYPATLWTQWRALNKRSLLSYYRSPQYQYQRLLICLMLALTFGSIYWGMGNNPSTEQKTRNILGALYLSNLFLGVLNTFTCLEIIYLERNVFYREHHGSGVYSWLPYASSQALAEAPYVLLQTCIYVPIVYAMINFFWTPYRFWTYFFASFINTLVFTFLGILIINSSSIMPIALTICSVTFNLMSLFSGFVIPRPGIEANAPWLIWAYWIDPLAHTINALASSQLGNARDQVVQLTSGAYVPVPEYIQTVYGFGDKLQAWASLGILIAFAIVFRVLGALALKVLNFQKR